MWSSLEEQAIRMRRAPTQAEERIWKHLRSGKLGGLKFRRQHPVGRFIVDFYCVSAGLVVEVDGPIHDEQADADAERQLYLEAMGLRVLRFSNDEALRNTFAVLDVIAEAATSEKQH